MTDLSPPSGAPRRRVTMSAVGRMAGVSQVTVSRALSDPSKVSPDTLARIRRAIEATGFVPNALAGALASSRSRLVSALVPSITNIVYASLLQTFSTGMREAGYQMLISETGFDPAEEERVAATHLSRRPDAMLLTGIHHSTGMRRMLLGAGIPVVEVWDLTDSPLDVCVGFSHAEAGRAVAAFARGAGHERAGVVSAGDARAGRRRDAFADAFGGDVLRVDLTGPATLAGGRDGLARLLDQGFARGVVFCSSDALAQGVLVEAASRGLSVPGDIAVVGFGDQAFAAHLDPPLTTVRVDREALGAAAADAVTARLSGDPVPRAIIDVGFRIVRRATA
ncbi:LacI family DNA-binding transcriptional regulator [Jannaschia sp. LMIT008]|uniref:LacI family DNA-binding transcriptional regulator n=1 Tax=Jannaschia maritima TaxID=3032585 RepID=UPI0028128152|nr:LacI family DNA-binding transcriptional regulator [Jannaschia sp. LMIT008]